MTKVEEFGTKEYVHIFSLSMDNGANDEKYRALQKEIWYWCLDNLPATDWLWTNGRYFYCACPKAALLFKMRWCDGDDCVDQGADPEKW